MADAFFAKKRVLVTGHTGFMGSWLTLWLQHRGARVTGYALAPPTEPSLFALAAIDRGLASIQGDVRDPEHLRRVVAETRPELVLHLAAQALVRRSYLDPVETYGTNVLGTVNLLDAVRQVGGVDAVVVVTSDKCYEDRDWPWGYRERDRLGGRDPYSSSKACAELVAHAYSSSFFREATGAGPALATARMGNVIGGGDFALDRIVPDFVRAQLRGEPLALRFPDAVRPWQHVLDPLAGLLELARRLCEDPDRFSGAWNFGPSPEETRSVAWIAEELSRAWGTGVGWVHAEGTHPPESHHLTLDSCRARGLLGWRPAWPPAQAIAATASWYRAWIDGADLRALTLGQIAGHENRPPEDEPS